MVRLIDSEALRILEQPSQPRFLGWTEEQWSIAAGQELGKYEPTPESAFELRRNWLNSEQSIDVLKKDPSFGATLFFNVAKRNHSRGFDLMDDRAKSCG